MKKIKFLVITILLLQLLLIVGITTVKATDETTEGVNFEITSPKGNYLTGEEIEIVATYNKSIDSSLKHELKIKFAKPSTERTITVGEVKGNTVTFKYKVQNDDYGEIEWISYNGVPTTSSWKSEVTANLLLSTGFEITSGKKNYLTGEKIVLVETYNKDIDVDYNSTQSKFELILHFEETEADRIVYGKANGNKVTYEYVVQEGDEGKLEWLSLNGAPTTSSYDSEVTANLLLSTGFEITSGKKNYLTGEKIVLVETYNKDIDVDYNSTQIKFELILHFEEPEADRIVYGKANGNKVTYEYVVQEGDKGKLLWLSFNGAPTTSSYDSEVTANLLLVTNFEITSPKGNYLTGEEIKIVATYNKNIDSSLKHELKIKFAKPSTERTITVGEVKGNTVTFKYTIQNDDYGEIEWISYNGAPTTSSWKSEVTANKKIADGDNTTAPGILPQTGKIAIIPISIAILFIITILIYFRYHKYKIS